MATIMLCANRINQMSGMINDVKISVNDYKSGLSVLKSKMISINRSVCNMDEIIQSIQSSSQTQDRKLASLDAFNRNNETFISGVIGIDNGVADVIKQKKDDFYAKFSYLKPEYEKTEWDKFCENLDSIGDWCKRHWKEIAIGLVCIIVGAILTALTGGAFAAALLAGLKAAAISALISGAISMCISLVSSGINGDSFGTACAKALNAFGDGFASGFMFGGIMAGVSMAISSAFKFAARLGATTGRSGGIGKGIFKFLSPDKIASDGNGGGTLIKIGKTFRIDFDTRVLAGGKYFNPLKLANFMHMHLPGVTQNVPGLLIVGGHIPIGLYISGILGGIFNKKKKGRVDE